ncbi:hypothetical protein C2845_PM07G38130 [Panicum miliaceum]|uniref:Uncharacterized protein n=1 Tax=Panicum miliaceum TaxID=4540 RepID=A0A3L6SGB6_PANMI|nr:hypothetical protein C2845_PM07G38130 [Panicum miliaceum]
MENAAGAGTTGSHGERGPTAEEIARATQDMLRRHREEQQAWNQYYEQSCRGWRVIRGGEIRSIALLCPCSFSLQQQHH